MQKFLLTKVLKLKAAYCRWYYCQAGSWEQVFQSTASREEIRFNKIIERKDELLKGFKFEYVKTCVCFQCYALKEDGRDHKECQNLEHKFAARKENSVYFFLWIAAMKLCLVCLFFENRLETEGWFFDKHNISLGVKKSQTYLGQKWSFNTWSQISH